MNSQVNKLVKALAKVSVTQPKPSKKKRNKRKKSQNSTPGSTGKQTVQAQGVINFSRLEYIADVKGAGGFDLDPSKFPYLTGLARCFEHYKWTKLVVHYKPAVGTTTAGAVTIGVNWANIHDKSDRAGVSTLTPMLDVPVWQAGNLVLPTSRLQTRREYILDSADVNDRQPCRINWATSSATDSVVGDLWITYSIQMFGTR